jgi:hypothetical protein
LFKKTEKMLALSCLIAQIIIAVPATAYAAGDPLTVVNNLSDFIFGLIRAIGMILLGFGIVQIGLSLNPTTLPSGPTASSPCGGVIITFAKEILTLITGG